MRYVQNRGIVTGYGLDNRGAGVWVPTESIILFSHIVQIGSRDHQVLPRVKRQGYEADHSTANSAEDKETLVYTFTPPTRHRDTGTTLPVSSNKTIVRMNILFTITWHNNAYVYTMYKKASVGAGWGQQIIPFPMHLRLQRQYNQFNGLMLERCHAILTWSPLDINHFRGTAEGVGTIPAS
jgi:hypothetical protein